MGTCTLISKIEQGRLLNGLQSKDNFDNVKPLNGKPSADTEGFTVKNSDLVAPKSDNGRLDSPIISDPPNLYKQTGVSVSKNSFSIPFTFTAIPEYFYTSGWLQFDNSEKFTKMMTFLHWSFKKCSSSPKRIPFDGKMIDLLPYEFIYGRGKSAVECGLTEGQLRNQLKLHLNAKLIEKSTRFTTNRYTVYRWLTNNFSENNNQHNDQPNDQPNNQSNDHKSDERRKKRDKEDHPSIPSFEKKGRDGKIDDLFSKEENKNKILVHEGKYHNGNPFQVYLTQEELDRCIQSKGSIERVKDAINQLATWPNRKYDIKEWANTIVKWNFKNVIGDRISDNEKLGKQIQDLYGQCQGWSACVYRDDLKDCRGVLFESSASVGNPIPIFVPFTEASFKEKCLEIIKSKNMKRKGKK